MAKSTGAAGAGGGAAVRNPYAGRPAKSFWRSAVAETSPLALTDIYQRKWPIERTDRIATAGSCFAQHVARYLRGAGYSIIDTEPAPNGLDPAVARNFGYGLYSARYANIYTARQLLQLVREAAGEWSPSTTAWPLGDSFVDPFRPSVEPDGLGSPEEVAKHRSFHVGQVRRMLEEMDVLVFTLGLTEGWVDKVSGEVFPTAPGTIAGSFDPARHAFVNYTYPEILADLHEAIAVIDRVRGERAPFRLLLTVSPVPLTATGGESHVLAASTYSKSTLRAVAGDLAESSPRIDYFPSYEIVTNPAGRGVFYTGNLRNVMSEGVEVVMRTFLAAHGEHRAPATAAGHARRGPARRQRAAPGPPPRSADDVQCEEALLEAFAPGQDQQ